MPPRLFCCRSLGWSGARFAQSGPARFPAPRALRAAEAKGNELRATTSGHRPQGADRRSVSVRADVAANIPAARARRPAGRGVHMVSRKRPSAWQKRGFLHRRAGLGSGGHSGMAAKPQVTGARRQDSEVRLGTRDVTLGGFATDPCKTPRFCQMRRRSRKTARRDAANTWASQPAMPSRCSSSRGCRGWS